MTPSSTTPHYADAEQRAATIAGLRELVDYLDSHPEVPLSHFGRVEVNVPLSSQGVSDAAAFAEADRIAALVRRAPARFANSTHYGVVREFGPAGCGVTYRATAIPSADRARHHALESYRDRVQPEPGTEEAPA